MWTLLGVWRQISCVEVGDKLLNLFFTWIIFSLPFRTCSHLKSKLLIEQEGWVGCRDVQGEVLAQVGLDQVVEHEGGQAIAPPGWVHCQVGEVRLAPPGKDKIVHNDEKMQPRHQTCNQGPPVQIQHRAFCKVQHKRSLERATLPQGQCQARTAEHPIAFGFSQFKGCLPFQRDS